MSPSKSATRTSDNSAARKKKAAPTSEAIYEEMLTAIFERKLQPGMRLKEEDLCEVFSMGRGGIRKVLQRLAYDKLVNIIPNSGAFVAQPSVAESKEVFQARRLIEAELVKELAGNFTPAKRQALEQHVAMEQQAHDDGDHSRRIRLSGQFHLLIGELADKPVMTEFLREIVSRTSLIIALYERSKSHVHKQPCVDHRALIELFAAGETDQAISLIHQHLLDIEAQLDLDPDDGENVDLKSIFGR